MNEQLIATLADIIGKLATGELVALDANIGQELPRVVCHTPLGAKPVYHKAGPTIVTLELRMKQGAKR